MFQILVTENSKLFSRDKETQLGGWSGTKEGLSYYILQIQLFHSPYLFHFYEKVFESLEAMWIQDSWSIFEKSRVRKV